MTANLISDSSRYIVTVWHGEAATHYYVVDALAPEGEQPAVIDTHASIEAAREHIAALDAEVAFAARERSLSRFDRWCEADD